MSWAFPGKGVAGSRERRCALPRGPGGGAVVRWLAAVGVVVMLVGVAVSAQRGGRGGRGWGRYRDPGDIETARQIESHSTGTPVWTNPAAFSADVFTFTRIRYDGNGGGRGGWHTDLPDSDLNLSFRLQQMTSMRVDPDGRIVRPTDPAMLEFPFVYIVEPGGLDLTDGEIVAMRNYLLNGGFLMLDDFWGDNEWENCEEVMRRVFPTRSFAELPLDHPLYRCVFEIKEKGQVPNVWTGVQSEYTGVTWERPDAQQVHHRVILDDDGRIMVMATHNTDNGDGWEREGESDFYFHRFSERISYPLGINIIFYAMTH